MIEYITKEQAVDALKETLWDDDFDEFLMHYFELSIKKVKPANVVEVVRCKDCRYFENVTTSGRGYCHCTLIGICNIVYRDDFCSNGKRNDGGESDD